MFRYLVIFFLLAILSSLFLALKAMVGGQGDGSAEERRLNGMKVVRALTLRIGLSLLLFALLLLGLHFGVVPGRG